MYNLFISHSWSYSNAYQSLISLLDGAKYFTYKNYSVPKDDPLTIRNKTYYMSELETKIRRQMIFCNAVVVLAGVYSSYSDSIDLEIKVALELNKPIIAVEPWGSKKTSAVVKMYATKTVAWNTNSIVGAIREVSK